MVDQIRIFKQYPYPFEVDYEIREALQRRIKEFSQHDLHMLAAQQSGNYTKSSSGSGLFGGLRRKGKKGK